ncbi:zinc-finger domain-containing protein [Paenibacillus bovis]|uniref:Zinc-finger domain-containing protein n=1 Tax=Paenibacillus bovis TaxID=1616788 RepID=A0A1X9T4A4_9BACL|nr:zinc-finger domain-containing protein [Paenibacillus bovis]ARR10672.1 hypothetical protein AR543_p0064 [Paenibacillus bovis]
MNRREVVQEISARLDGICRSCTIRQQLQDSLQPGGQKDSTIDRYCIKQCAVGKELQQLGKKLGAKDPLMPDEQLWYRSPKRRAAFYQTCGGSR